MTTMAIYQLPSGQTRTIREAEYRKQQGRSKGGYSIQASGKAHRWTSESARQAALKGWKRKRFSPFKGREGIRMGVAVHRRPRLCYRELREQYADCPTGRIRYHRARQEWQMACPCWVILRVLSERQALRYLGHLPWPTPRTAVGCQLVRTVQDIGSRRKRMTTCEDGSTVIQW